jgi:S1-C subfamily serine protease
MMSSYSSFRVPAGGSTAQHSVLGIGDDVAAIGSRLGDILAMLTGVTWMSDMDE